MVSNIGDSWKDQFPKNWPQVPLNPTPIIIPPSVSQAEFDKLRHEVQELKKLLAAAKAFDAATGQPHCEMDEKVKLIKAIAKMVGVDLADVFEEPEGKPNP